MSSSKLPNDELREILTWLWDEARQSISVPHNLVIDGQNINLAAKQIEEVFHSIKANPTTKGDK